MCLLLGFQMDLASKTRLEMATGKRLIWTTLLTRRYEVLVIVILYSSVCVGSLFVYSLLSGCFQQGALDASGVSDVEIARDASVVLPALDESGLMGTMDKSIAESDFGYEDQPDLAFNDDYGALEVDNGLEIPPSPSSQSLDISTDLNVSINNSRTSLDFVLANEEEDAAKSLRPKKKRRIGRDSVTELNSAVLKKVRANLLDDFPSVTISRLKEFCALQGMSDVSDITRTRNISYRRPNTSSFGASTTLLTTGPDLFNKPCILDISEDLLSMFKYTMKKRKFPFISEDIEDGQGDKADEVEQTRRQSNASVRSHAIDVYSAIETDSCVVRAQMLEGGRESVLTDYGSALDSSMHEDRSFQIEENNHAL